MRLYYDIEIYLDRGNFNNFIQCVLAVESEWDQCRAGQAGEWRGLTLQDAEQSGSEDVAWSEVSPPSTPPAPAPCSLCKSVSKVFTGTDCIKKFMVFLLELELQLAMQVGKICVLVHNRG